MSEHHDLVPADETPKRPALLRPVAQPADIIAAHREAVELIGKVLEEGVDYGVVPGTGDKPTLLKPGAERLCVAFGVAPTYRVAEAEIDHDRVVEWVKRKKRWLNRFQGDRHFAWEEEHGVSLGLYRYTVLCRLVVRATGEIAGEGLGVCSTMESRYIDRPRDSENTCLKMAQKRALVGAVLNAFGLSNRFTQDVEDLPDRGEDKPQQPQQSKAKSKREPRAERSTAPRDQGGQSVGELVAELVARYREAIAKRNPEIYQAAAAAQAEAEETGRLRNGAAARVEQTRVEAEAELADLLVDPFEDEDDAEDAKGGEA